MQAQPQSKGFFNTLWDRDLKEFLGNLLADLVKSISVLLSLATFQVMVALLRWVGMHAEYLNPLERVDFTLMYAAMWVVGLSFIGKLVAALWRQKR